MTVLLIVVQLLIASPQPTLRFVPPVPQQVVTIGQAGIRFVRVAVGVVMRTFVGVMLGSNAFPRAGRRS